MDQDKWRDYRIGFWLGLITIGIMLLWIGASR